MTYRLSDVYTAVADPHRRAILDLLMSEDRNIAEIANNFDISRTAVDKHINVLIDADLVVAKRIGRSRVHALNPEPMRMIWEWIQPYSEFWAERLQRLKDNVERD